MYNYEVIVTRNNGKDELYTRCSGLPHVTVDGSLGVCGELKGKYEFVQLPMDTIRTVSIFVTYVNEYK